MFRDCDYIKTKDNIIFIVRGDYHAQDAVRATVVYFPSEDGDRFDKRTGQKYIKKIEEFPFPDSVIAKIHPEYLPKRNELIKSLSIPIHDIVRHYRPRGKMEECLRDGVLKNTKWEALILAINQIADIPIKDIGVYGSLLVGLNKDNSDVDILVYGKENLVKLRNNFDIVLSSSGVQKASREQRIARIHAWKQAAKDSPKYSPIDFDKLQRIESRRWSRINVCGDDITSIRFAYGDDEIPQNLITSSPIKEIKEQGVVIESVRTHFSQKVAKVLINNKRIEVITDIFVFFSCVFDGDEVEIFGNYRKDGQREYITLDDPLHYICPITEI